MASGKGGKAGKLNSAHSTLINEMMRCACSKDYSRVSSVPWCLYTYVIDSDGVCHQFTLHEYSKHLSHGLISEMYATLLQGISKDEIMV